MMALRRRNGQTTKEQKEISFRQFATGKPTLAAAGFC
jgi:hypothetical protein